MKIIITSNKTQLLGSLRDAYYDLTSEEQIIRNGTFTYTVKCVPHPDNQWYLDVVKLRRIELEDTMKRIRKSKAKLWKVQNAEKEKEKGSQP